LRISFVNHGFSRITGYSAEDALGRSPRQLRLSASEEPVFDALFESVRHNQPFQMELPALRPDNSTYALEIHATPVTHGAQRSSHWIAILRDVSDRKAHLDELRHQALHDALTGLPNRLLLHDRIEQSLQALRRSATPFALLFLDLDGFKEINDTFGHYTGDVLLTSVGARLRAQLRSTDMIARLGGDEFAIVISGDVESQAAGEFAVQLLKALEAPFEIEEHKLVVAASIGIVHAPRHGSDPMTLMRRADVAMYAAKSARAGTMTYETEQDAHSPARIRLISELRGMIDDQHMVLHYQPEIDLISGQVVRVEALLRWQHPDRGLLLPDEFLPLVEASEVIDRIARWVLKTAIRDCRAWQDSGIVIGVSVNLSPHNLRDTRLPEYITRTLSENGLDSSRLTIEITESGILGDKLFAAGIFQRLRVTGVGLSIDDFGTGYSSLVHLKQLPFTELKVDRSFTCEMMSNEHDAAIVRSTIDLGHELGRRIVAEGVETREVLEQLRKYGCDYAQGYFISPPLEKTLLRAWLLDPPSLGAAGAG
jgi:diguanylate cyclase (GGDEF)-like protein/PAS domain S-box-containing protein